MVVQNGIASHFDRKDRVQFPQPIFDPLLAMLTPLTTHKKRPPNTPRNTDGRVISSKLSGVPVRPFPIRYRHKSTMSPFSFLHI